MAYALPHSDENPYVVVADSRKTLTGHVYSVLDTRTGETLGANLSKRLATDIAAEEWAQENGEE